MELNEIELTENAEVAEYDNDAVFIQKKDGTRLAWYAG